MDKIQKDRGWLPRIVSLTVAGLVAVITAVGMAPASADQQHLPKMHIVFTSPNSSADINTKGDKLSAEVEAEVETNQASDRPTIDLSASEPERSVIRVKLEISVNG